MPSERFLFLERTLREIDGLAIEIDKAANALNESKNHYNEIESEIELTKSRLQVESERIEDYDNKKREIEEKIRLNVDKRADANYAAREHSKSKLNGLSSKKFRKENLDKKTEEIRAKSDEEAAVFVILALLSGAFFGILSGVVYTSLFPLPDFICTASKEEIPYEDVLDGVEDCPDGSDEETSSWSSDMTRAEAHENTPIWDGGLCTVCSIFFIGGIAMPYGITSLRGDKVVLLQEKFKQKHQHDLIEAEKLERDVQHFTSEVQRSKVKLQKLDEAKLNFLNLRSRLGLLEGKQITEAKENVIRNQKSCDKLNSNIAEKWESIADMVPYGNKIL